MHLIVRKIQYTLNYSNLLYQHFANVPQRLSWLLRVPTKYTFLSPSRLIWIYFLMASVCPFRYRKYHQCCWLQTSSQQFPLLLRMLVFCPKRWCCLLDLLRPVWSRSSQGYPALDPQLFFPHEWPVIIVPKTLSYRLILSSFRQPFLDFLLGHPVHSGFAPRWEES